jgi:putative glutamine amidotransferase
MSDSQELKVAIAYPAFFGAFQKHFPNLEIIGENYKSVKNYNLVIFSGGEDVNPVEYGGDNKYSVGINEMRDKIEIAVFNECQRQKVKMLGVCRGHQLINALLGGMIIQDLFFEMGEDHSGYHSLNFVRQNPESIVQRCFQNVNSMHHQGVLRSGKGFTTTSVHKGICESTEKEDCISVQFHPEFMSDKQSDEFFYWIKLWAGNSDVFEREFYQGRPKPEPQEGVKVRSFGSEFMEPRLVVNGEEWLQRRREEFQQRIINNIPEMDIADLFESTQNSQDS